MIDADQTTRSRGPGWALVLAWAALVLGAAPAALAAEPALLRVYLPRSAKTQQETLTLGELAILRCDDEQVLAKASAVQLGRGPQSGEKMLLDRNTVQVRLAGAGLRGRNVLISGAAQVAVERDDRPLAAEEIVQSAQRLLEDQKAATPNTHLELACKVEDVFVPAGLSVTLRAQAQPAGQPNQVRVRVAVLDGQRELASRDVIYRRMYTVRQAVLTRDVAAGEPFNEANVRVQSATAERPQEADWAPPLGQVASSALKAGTVLTPGHARAGAASSGAGIKKNQVVTMRIQGSGFVLTGLGTALQDGKAGELVKVRNNDSQRIVTARVAADGSVEPVMEEAGAGREQATASR